MRLKDTDKIMLTLNEFWYSSFGQEQNDFSLAIQECMKIIEDAPSADIIPQPTVCVLGVVQQHDNGMISMTKETWEVFQDTLKRYRDDIETLTIAIREKEDGIQ